MAQSAVRNPQSSVLNQQSAISNQQSSFPQLAGAGNPEQGSDVSKAQTATRRKNAGRFFLSRQSDNRVAVLIPKGLLESLEAVVKPRASTASSAQCV